MPKLTFLPMNLTFDVSPGESILDVAIANDVPIQHACGGFCACTTCHVIIKSGKEHLTEIEEEEHERIEYAKGVTLESRLGCQAKLHRGDVTVEIVNLDD